MAHRQEEVGWIKAFYGSAVAWWGESWYDGDNLRGRLELVERYGKGRDILELAAGTGETAAFLCDRGYSVCAVDICEANIGLLRKAQATRPSLEVVEGDYLSIRLDRKFKTVCLFETFGLGSDRQQRALLRRIQEEWLEDDGVLIMDVYHPYGPIKYAGRRFELDRLDGVPGSVDMTEYTWYDPVRNRWIDIWEPRDDKAGARTQSIRCYSPADLALLMDGSGLEPAAMEARGKPIDFRSDEVSRDNVFENCGRNDFSYIVVARKKAE